MDINSKEISENVVINSKHSSMKFKMNTYFEELFREHPETRIIDLSSMYF